MENEEFSRLQDEFLQIARDNLCPDDDDVLWETMDEARYQVTDWYAGQSYYGKPEDILEDYFFLTPEQAHKYLILFKERN